MTHLVKLGVEPQLEEHGVRFVAGRERREEMLVRFRADLQIIGRNGKLIMFHIFIVN